MNIHPVNVRHVDTLLKSVYDAHCHFHLNTSDAGVASAHQILSKLSTACLMSTQPSDWPHAISLSQASNTRCLLGIHPWFAHLYPHQDSWLPTLRSHLASTVGSAIGEIGLDRQWRTPDTGKVEYQAQLKVFQTQLSLAAELNLPVSIHCVRAQGDLQKILHQTTHLPPTIYLHAFGGAAGTVEQLIRSKRFGDRLYFGFATCINLRTSKTKSVIAAVPANRLVVESDRGSALPTSRIENELFTMLEIYKEVKGWSSIEDAAKYTHENACRLYAPADKQR